MTDSPIVLDAAGEEPAGFYPTGIFHSRALSLALDAAAIAMAQVAALSEKRLHRVLDSRFSGLPDQLAADAARGGSGLVSLHKSVVGLCAENRLLAAPASIHSADTSGGREDFQAFTGLAASKLSALLDNIELILANELVADRQAHTFGASELPQGLDAVLAAIAEHIEPVSGDRTLAPVVEAVRTVVRSGSLCAPADVG